jgi:hypothetical protein
MSSRRTTVEGVYWPLTQATSRTVPGGLNPAGPGRSPPDRGALRSLLATGKYAAPARSQAAQRAGQT